MIFEDRPQGQQNFIEAYTKQLLVRWAMEQLHRGHFTVLPGREIYFEFAKSKGWIKKKAPNQLNGTGFKRAASTCKASTAGGGWRP